MQHPEYKALEAQRKLISLCHCSDESLYTLWDGKVHVSKVAFMNELLGSIKADSTHWYNPCTAEYYECAECLDKWLEEPEVIGALKALSSGQHISEYVESIGLEPGFDWLFMNYLDTCELTGHGGNLVGSWLTKKGRERLGNDIDTTNELF